MVEFLPPSSSVTRLRCRLASSPTRRPAAVDPVNEIIAMFGSSIIASPAAASPGSTCSRPAGNPADSNRRASMKPPVTGVLGSGFSTTALPRASAGATARLDRISGALNGEITPTTPCGTRRAKLMRLAPEGSIMPGGCVAIDAASSRMPITMCSSKSAFGGIEPVSRTIHGRSESACASSSCAARRSTAARWSAGVLAHAGCAAAAAAAASRTSSASAMPTSVSTLPVAGSKISRAPPLAICQRPVKILPFQAFSAAIVTAVVCGLVMNKPPFQVRVPGTISVPRYASRSRSERSRRAAEPRITIAPRSIT